jgi:hypothetical protein
LFIGELRLGRVKFQPVNKVRAYVVWDESLTNLLYWERSMGNLASAPDMMVDVKVAVRTLS